MMNKTDELTDEEKRELINRGIEKHHTKLYQDYRRITSYNHERFEDLLPFCIHEFLTKKPLDYQFQVVVKDDTLPNYMGRAMSLNLRSSSSPFWHKYRQEGYNSRGAYLAEEEDRYLQGSYDEIPDLLSPAEDVDPYECMLSAIKKLDFYHQPLLTDYYLNSMTYSQMNKKYGIPLNHLKKAVETAIKQIRQHCKHFIK